MLIMRTVDRRVDGWPGRIRRDDRRHGRLQRIDDQRRCHVGAGLADPSEGAVVDFGGPEPTSTPGAYGSLRELFNGFWIVEVASQDEAIAWAKKAPLEAGSQIEVRRINGPEDFPEDNEWIQKEKEWIEQGRLDNG